MVCLKKTSKADLSEVSLSQISYDKFEYINKFKMLPTLNFLTLAMLLLITFWRTKELAYRRLVAAAIVFDQNCYRYQQLRWSYEVCRGKKSAIILGITIKKSPSVTARPLWSMSLRWVLLRRKKALASLNLSTKTLF